MSDKKLYQEIRRLVRQLKEKQQLNCERQDFAQEYCRVQMRKKKLLKPKEPSKLNHLFLNFKNVESYINIMDIIKNLHISIDDYEEEQEKEEVREEIPQCIPKTLQMKIKQRLRPIHNQKLREEAEKRAAIIDILKDSMDGKSRKIYQGGYVLHQVESTFDNPRMDGLEMLDVWKEDVKRNEIHSLQKKFNQEIKDIQKVPVKIQNTKIFHKVCSYLHMILEQEHREKWSSHQDKKIREARRQHSRQFVRVSKLENKNISMFQRTAKTSHRRFFSVPQSCEEIKTPEMTSCFSSIQNLQEEKPIKKKKPNIFANEKSKNQILKNEKLKQTFTFRRRNVKDRLMVKINQFVDGVNNEEKKNIEVSKKYGKAMQTLAEGMKSSYNRYEKEEIIEQEDVDDMKKYLFNTLSRNKKDLKRFCRK